MMTAMRSGSVLLGLSIALAVGHPAIAADMPIKAAPAVADSGAFYIWADGSWDRVKLPDYTLGPGRGVGPTATYGGQILSLDSTVTGFNVAGGIGYRLPGNWPGSNARIEVGGLYVEAKGSRNDVSTFDTASGTLQLLDGQFRTSFGCIGICTATTALATSYRNWQADLRFATDYRLGPVTLTPSVALFGGSAHNDQTYALRLNNGFSAILNSFYNASTSLKWSDIGVRLGLDTRLPLTDWLSVGVGGWAGAVARRVDLTGADSQFTINSLGNPSAVSTSAITASADKSAFVANLEGNLYIRPTPSATFRLFGGLNYDDAVPGVRAPSFVGPFTFAAPTIPAGIDYHGLTSYYAGGGLIVRFGS